MSSSLPTAEAVGLNQLSRLMFDKAALTWQWSIGLELFAGAVGMGLALSAVPAQANLAGAMFVLAVLVVAFLFRYSANDTYDDAETMRRQAVLSEGLGWELGRAELMEWRSRAGPALLARAALTPRPDDYYDNTLGEGSKKLAEMTFESAHWTKCLYTYLRRYLVIALVLAGVVVVVLVSVSLFDVVPAADRTALAYAAFLFAPVVLTIDFLGMVLKLNRAIAELKSLSVHLDKAAKLTKPGVPSVMRLVAEYNCVVSAGVPIANWIWKRHSKAIADSWKAVP